ncbi:ATP-binding response regulator [Thalassolituus maritimus]|uniref:histidine kinase n=1 Tax=Thalassolituus maritimus TaxID=484498 RepID=A0ABP9ZXV6_9GAMM
MTTEAVEIELSDEDIDAFRRRRATDDLYDRISTIAFGTLILTTVLIFNQSPPAGEVYGYIWYSLCVGLEVFGTGLLWCYRNYYQRRSLTFWRGMYMSGVTVLAALWGSAGVLFFNVGVMTEQMLLFVLIVGVTVSSVSTNSVWLLSHAVYLVVSTLPLIIMCLSQADPQYRGIGLAFLAYIGVAFSVARSGSITYRDMMALTLKNMRLAESLREQYEITDAASRAKTQFLASASHDLRQPVHSLSLLSESMRQETETERGQQLVSHIRSAVTSIDDLLGKLLDISRLDAGDVHADIRDFPLDALINSLVIEARPVAEEKGLTLETSPHHCAVRSDPVLLGNILRNLISNAIKYTDNGRVEINTGITSDGTDNDTVHIRIRDTGMGIPADQHEKVFQEFVQLNNPERDRQKGLGLGLSVCRRLTTLLGHELSVESATGQGSEFTLSLARAELQEPVVTTIEGQASTAAGVFAGINVLLVEDDAMVRESTVQLLEGWGCDVRAFAEAAAGFDSVVSEPEWPDLLLTDYRLPGDMDGQELSVRVREEISADLPVLMITGDTAPEQIKAFSEGGIVVLHKPVKPGFLRNAMRQALIAV